MIVTFTVLFSQIWQQFPCSFEYNEDFLIMLFKHAYASQFGMFSVLIQLFGLNFCLKVLLQIHGRSCVIS